MRLVDYLQTRGNLDTKRIGLTGISKGGIETYLAAAVDTRIAAAVPCIGVQSFRWSAGQQRLARAYRDNQPAFDAVVKESGVTNADTRSLKFYDRIVPGIYGEFRGLPCSRSRATPLMPSDDEQRFQSNHTPLPGVNVCVEAARKAYHAAQEDDHFAVRIQERTGHRITPESEQVEIEWFVKWLKP